MSFIQILTVANMSSKMSELCWERAGLDGGHPCVGNFFACECRTCVKLEQIVLADGIRFRKSNLQRIKVKYLKTADLEILKKWKEKFQNVVEDFMREMSRKVDEFQYIPDDEAEENIRAFLQRERSSEDVAKEFWHWLKEFQMVDQDEELPQGVKEDVKEALKEVWKMYRP